MDQAQDNPLPTFVAAMGTSCLNVFYLNSKSTLEAEAYARVKQEVFQKEANIFCNS